jgi:hypothetical protein
MVSTQFSEDSEAPTLFFVYVHVCNNIIGFHLKICNSHITFTYSVF